MNLEILLPFIKEIDRLKTIERQTLIHSGGRRENTAEHSWHLALAVMVFHKYSPEKVDLDKAIKMALLHDVVEIDAGDSIVYGPQTGKKEAEEKALRRIMGLLPKDLNQELSEIWLEFESGDSVESRFVSALDRFLPLFSNNLNGGHSWKNHNVTADRVKAKCQPPIEKALPDLWILAEKMLNESILKGDLKKSEME